MDKKKGVRDLRADSHGEMKHMFSMIAVKSRVSSNLTQPAVNCNLESLTPDMVLPSADDVSQIKRNLIVLVSRIICQYIQCLSSFAGAVVTHIPHAHSEKMAEKSETFVLHFLPKNEAKHADMIKIMQELQGYLGGQLPTTQRVISGAISSRAKGKFVPNGT